MKKNLLLGVIVAVVVVGGVLWLRHSRDVVSLQEEKRLQITVAVEGEEVVVRNETQILQTIPIDPFILEQYRDLIVSYDKDFTYDGYADLKLLSAHGASNAVYEIWKYVPERKVFDRVLTELFNPEFREAERQIVTHSNNGHAGLLYGSVTYGFQDSEWILVTQEMQVEGPEFNTYIRTISTLQNGELKVAERYKVVCAPDETTGQFSCTEKLIEAVI